MSTPRDVQPVRKFPLMLLFPRMIIDFHTHIFPPEVRDRRQSYLQRDPTFAEMYSSPKAKIASAADLIESMDAAGVDVSVALGFAWREHGLCLRHNDYLLEAAARYPDRIIPFCIVNPLAGQAAREEVARCARAGARGLGELRPESQGYDLKGEAGDAVASWAARHNLILLFHVTEPGGHQYPGKRGLPLSEFQLFIERHPLIKVVGAHLGGGLPLHCPSAKGLANVYVDTAAMPYLYGAEMIGRAMEVLGGRVLMGSDYPLVSQARQIELIRSAAAEGVGQILGSTAASLLGL